LKEELLLLSNDPTAALFDNLRTEIEAGRSVAAANESESSAVDVKIDRIGPPALYGAVGVAMFQADFGGLRIDQKINLVGNAAHESYSTSSLRAHSDGSLTLDNKSVQRLMDYGLLHCVDDGWRIGPWPESNAAQGDDEFRNAANRRTFERMSQDETIEQLTSALELARNRLRAAAINEAPKGTKEYYQYSEWADEADKSHRTASQSL
jgi:hypothetical protein